MKKFVFIAVVGSIFSALLLGGCATPQTLSSSKIGCAPDDITITDQHLAYGVGMTTWIATCKGKRYVCSAISARDTSCTAEQK